MGKILVKHISNKEVNKYVERSTCDLYIVYVFLRKKTDTTQ